MKKKIESKKQLDRKREIEREKKKKEIKKHYYIEKKEHEKLGLDSWYRFDSIEGFTEKRLNEWDQQQLKIPTGKYRDEEKVVSTYQQKFVEFTLKLCPEVFEELQEFVPYFDRLFGEQKDKFVDIFDTSKREIFELNNTLHSQINYLLIKSILTFKPGNLQNWRYDYQWGEYRALLDFLYFLFVPDEPDDKRNEVLQDMNQLLQKDIIERNGIKLSADIDDSTSQKHISSKIPEIIKALVLNDEQKYFRASAERKVVEFLQEVSPTPKNSIADFIKLQIKLLNWAERHNLQKDWMLRYAYFFMYQFSINRDTKLSEIEVPSLDVRSLEGDTFSFKFDGWLVSDERKEDYEKRITENFESELQKYFHNVSNYLTLEGKLRTTKPIKYDRVKWLVRWTVQGWSKEQILEEIDNKPQKPGAEKFYDVRTIELAFEQFESFELPVRT